MNRNGSFRQPEAEIASDAVDEASNFIPLEEDRLRTALDRRCVDEGHPNEWDVRVAATTASTNSDLLREARDGHAFTRPAVLAAEIQTAGRGRLGRSWDSARGASLTVSYAFCVTRRLGELEGISLVCGLAVRDALARHDVHAELKWPNDVLIDDRKLAGILVEAHALPTSTIVIVGVGINVLPRDPDTASSDARAVVPAVIPVIAAIDLRSAGSTLEDRNVLAADLGIAIETRFARFTEKGFAEFASEWNAVDAFRDRRVSLGTALNDTVVGMERGVDAAGHLLIEIDGKQQRFIAGDLSLRVLASA